MADRDTISNVKHFENTPYFDDFDETKNYHRILFRPGFAVQARELTQLQTSLQSQIDKLGQAFYSDGDRVLGGKGTLLAGEILEKSSENCSFSSKFIKIELYFTFNSSSIILIFRPFGVGDEYKSIIF